VANRIEEIKQAKDGLDILDDIYRYAKLGFDSIPPEDYERMKWYGLFHRSQTPGFFMMRLRIPNGILTSDQITQLGKIVNHFGRGKADITTRQNIQFRWLRIEDVPAIFDALREVDILHLQSGMDNVRNVTGCPLAGLDPSELLDASRVARAIQDEIIGRKEFSNLPRKFNISVSGCRDDCAMSQIHDIGLTPASRDGSPGFNVRVGGAMGGKDPRFSLDLDVFVKPEQAPALCREIVALFRDEGLRENRQRARLKWLLQEWGIDRFRRELENRAGPLTTAGLDEVTSHGGDHVGARKQKQRGTFAVGCLVPVGRVSGDDLIEFGRLATLYGTGEVRLTNDQNVIIVNVPETSLGSLRGEPLLQKYSPDPSTWLRRMVSCTGNDYCHFSLIDTKASAVELARSMERLAPLHASMRVHWSGCPHACGQHHIADIGLHAARVRIGDAIVDAADVYLGGRLGPDARLGTKVLDAVPLTELPARLVGLLEDGTRCQPSSPNGRPLRRE
jgi:ferredoxin-nitrite reductase